MTAVAPLQLDVVDEMIVRRKEEEGALDPVATEQAASSSAQGSFGALFAPVLCRRDEAMATGAASASADIGDLAIDCDDDASLRCRRDDRGKPEEWTQRKLHEPAW